MVKDKVRDTTRSIYCDPSNYFLAFILMVFFCTDCCLITYRQITAFEIIPNSAQGFLCTVRYASQEHQSWMWCSYQ